MIHPTSLHEVASPQNKKPNRGRGRNRLVIKILSASMLYRIALPVRDTAEPTTQHQTITEPEILPASVCMGRRQPKLLANPNRLTRSHASTGTSHVSSLISKITHASPKATRPQREHVYGTLVQSRTIMGSASYKIPKVQIHRPHSRYPNLDHDHSCTAAMSVITPSKAGISKAKTKEQMKSN